MQFVEGKLMEVFGDFDGVPPAGVSFMKHNEIMNGDGFDSVRNRIYHAR